MKLFSFIPILCAVFVTSNCIKAPVKTTESLTRGYDAANCHGPTPQKRAREIARTLVAAKFPSHLIPKFVCHANFESTFGANKRGICPDCYGTWQIKSGTRGDFCPEYTNAEINNSDLKNAKCVLKILKGQGERAWQNVGACDAGDVMYKCFESAARSAMNEVACKPVFVGQNRAENGDFTFTYRSAANSKRCGDTVEVFIGTTRIDKRALPADGNLLLTISKDKIARSDLSIKLYGNSGFIVKSMIKIPPVPVTTSATVSSAPAKVENFEDNEADYFEYEYSEDN